MVELGTLKINIKEAEVNSKDLEKFIKENIYQFVDKLESDVMDNYILLDIDDNFPYSDEMNDKTYVFYDKEKENVRVVRILDNIKMVDKYYTLIELAKKFGLKIDAKNLIRRTNHLL